MSITQDSTGAQGRRQTSLQVANFSDVEASARRRLSRDRSGLHERLSLALINSSRGYGPDRIQSGATPIPNVDGNDPEVCVVIRKQIHAAAPWSHRPLIAVLVLGAASPLRLGLPDGPQLAEARAEGG